MWYWTHAHSSADHLHPSFASTRREENRDHAGQAGRQEDIPTPQEVFGLIARIIGSALFLAVLIESCLHYLLQ
jgi:hypothetical protein